MSKQIAVWIDHQEARVFAVRADKVDEEVVLAPHRIHHIHTRDAQSVKGHPEDDKRFFREVANSFEGVEQVLIVGPSTTKLEFLGYIEKHDHAQGPKVVGVETVDHPTDKQLAAYAKSYFKRIARME